MYQHVQPSMNRPCFLSLSWSCSLQFVLLVVEVERARVIAAVVGDDQQRLRAVFLTTVRPLLGGVELAATAVIGELLFDEELSYDVGGRMAGGAQPFRNGPLVLDFALHSPHHDGGSATEGPPTRMDPSDSLMVRAEQGPRDWRPGVTRTRPWVWLVAS